MHVESIPKPLLCLAADLLLFAGLISLWLEMLREVLDEIFCKSSRLGNDKWLRSTGGFDRDHWRLSQRVDLLELWTSKHVFASLEDFDVVVHALAFFEEPYYALSTALLEPEEVVSKSS